MRIASFLFDELSPHDLRPAAYTPLLTGRALMTTWIAERIRAHPAVEEFAICGVEEAPIPGITILQFPQLNDWVAKDKLVWFEPARHYWWRPGLVRQVYGRTFPIVTMIHSLGYGAQFQPLVQSLVTPAQLGDTVIAPSNHAADVFRRQAENIIELFGLTRDLPQVTVIPYGVPPVPHIPREMARKLLGWDETPVLLFIGRLSYQDKADFDALFEAAARLTAKHLDFRLILAGADAERQSELLRSRAAAYDISGLVTVLPNISDTDKHVLLSGCDIFVSPSNTVTESFGLSPIEAMLHECPVVCTSWSGYKEIVRDGIDGLLIHTWWNKQEHSDLSNVINTSDMLSSQVAIDIPQLAHHLETLLHSSDLRRSMGVAGQKRAASLYHIDTTVKSIVSVMEQIKQSFAYHAIPAIPLAFASLLGSYADTIWTGDMTLKEDQALSLQRAMRTGPPQDLVMLKQDCFNHLRPDRAADRFRLLRRGLARNHATYDDTPFDT